MRRIDFSPRLLDTFRLMCIILSCTGYLAIADDTVEYRQLCERKLGTDATGLILRDIGSDQWELVAVASGPVVERSGVDTSQSFREAVLIADALAHQTLAKFISGVQVKASDESLTDSRIVIDSTESEKTRERFVQQIRGHQQQDVFAFLRGTRRVAEWRRDGGADAFVAVTLNQADIQKGLDISRTILKPSLGADRFEVIQTNDVDQGPQRVRVVGMASVGSRSVPEARRMAIYDGLQLAVQRVAGLTLSSRTSLEDLRRLESKLSSITAGMVKSFLILEENRSSDGYSVLLEVEVQRNLGGSIELLQDLLGNLKTAIAGQKGTWDGNYCLDLCRQGLEQRHVPHVNLGLNPRLSSSSSSSMTKSPGGALTLARASGSVVMIWCDTDEWLQAYCVATGEKIGSRLGATFKRNDGSTGYGWKSWDLWNEWFDAVVVAHWYDEVFNGTYVSIVISGEYLSSPGKWYATWRKDSNVARKAVGRVEGALQDHPKCKVARRTNIDSEGGAVYLTLRWAGFVEDVVRDVFEKAESKVTGKDTAIESLELEGNVISVQIRQKP